MEVVDRSNKPPVWDNLERISRAVYVKENTAVGETVTTVRARSQQILLQKKLRKQSYCLIQIFLKAGKRLLFFKAYLCSALLILFTTLTIVFFTVV